MPANGQGYKTRTDLDHLHRAVEVGAGAIHLVDETHARDAVLVRLHACGGGGGSTSKED